MVDKVRLLKIENTTNGSETNFGPTEINPQQDYAAVKGISFEENDGRTIDLDVDGNFKFKDANNPTGRTLKNITDDINAKYPASNPSSFETSSQLNARDTVNKERANHTGSQTSSTISDFSSSVLATVLAGLSLLTGTPVVNTDSAITAFGKIQAQINNITSNIAETVRTTLLTGIVFTDSTNVTATDTVRSAFGKIQAKLTAHFGSGGGVHALVTDTVNGFMSALDKVKLDKLGTNYSSLSNVNTTTTSLTPVVLNSMQIVTPILGNYLAMASAHFRLSVADSTVTVGLYVGGVLVPNSEGVLLRGGNQADIVLTYIILVSISANGTQNVEVRWHVSAGTGTSTVRSIYLLKVV